MYQDISIQYIWLRRSWSCFTTLCEVKTLRQKCYLSLVTLINLIPIYYYYLDNMILQPRFWFNNNYWLFSYCQKRGNIIFIRIKGLWWWFWIFGLNDVYWSKINPVSKNYIQYYLEQNWIFSEQFELWHRFFLPVWCQIVLSSLLLRLHHLFIVIQFLTI